MSSVPIAEHALLSDRHTAAPVTSAGSVGGLCCRRFDGTSVFARLLDDNGGHWSLRPAGEYIATRRYLDRTMVLETTFESAAATVHLTDALATGPGNQGHQLGRGAPRLLVRALECTRGEAEVELTYR